MNRTKDAIIQTFWELLEEKPYNKITVKDIVDSCQINRNTFYYYFHDIPELLILTIKNYADEIIQAYDNFESPVEFILPVVQHCMNHKKAILHIYRSVHREAFLNEFDKICLYFVTRYIDTATISLALCPEDKELLIRLYKCAVMGIFLDWLNEGMSYDLITSFSRISELLSGSGKQAFLKAAASDS